MRKQAEQALLGKPSFRAFVWPLPLGSSYLGNCRLSDVTPPKVGHLPKLLLAMVFITPQKADQDAFPAFSPAGPVLVARILLLLLVYIFPETFAELLELVFSHWSKGPSRCVFRDEILRPKVSLSAGRVLGCLTVSVHKALSIH